MLVFRRMVKVTVTHWGYVPGHSVERKTPEGSWGSPVAKGDRPGLENLRLVDTPLPRPAVGALANWPRALPHYPPSNLNLRGVCAGSRC